MDIARVCRPEAQVQLDDEQEKGTREHAGHCGLGESLLFPICRSAIALYAVDKYAIQNGLMTENSWQWQPCK